MKCNFCKKKKKILKPRELKYRIVDHDSRYVHVIPDAFAPSANP